MVHEPEIAYTRWPSLYRKKTYTSHIAPWSKVVEDLFDSHLLLPDKFESPGFGPYSMLGPDRSRADEHVDSISMMVFDADAGPLAPALERLTDQGLTHLAYTTYSHLPDRPAWRLVVPLARPISATRPEWPSYRKLILSTYAVPADPKSSAGRSHFYFLPSCPPLATPQILRYDGPRFLEPPPHLSLRCATYPLRALPPSWSPPPEPEGPVDLEPLRARLADRASRIARRDPTKARLLRDVLDGRPLAEHGARNTTTLSAAGVVAWTLPEASVGTLFAILRPSVDAMISAGSKITYDQVERMLLGGIEHRAQADQRDEEIKRVLTSAL